MACRRLHFIRIVSRGQWPVVCPHSFIHFRKGAIYGLFFSVAFSLVSGILFFAFFFAIKISFAQSLLLNHCRSFKQSLLSVFTVSHFSLSFSSESIAIVFISLSSTAKNTMLFTKTAILSAMAALASAYTQPDYNQSPSGNAITKPGLNDLVTAGKPYTIEWDPTTEGPISLVLLRGPSTNVQPIDTLAESIDNSGHFDWTPSTDLEPDTTHYGLMLVVEGSGQYQYSTQFGVKNEEHGAASSSAASSSTPATTETPVSKGDGLHTIYSTEEFVTTRCPKCSAEASAASASATSTSATPATTLSSIPVSAGTSSTAVSSSSASATSSSSVAAATSTKASPSDAAAVTGSDSGSASGSASSSAPTSVFTGAADRNAVGLGAVAAGMLAVFAF